MPCVGLKGPCAGIDKEAAGTSGGGKLSSEVRVDERRPSRARAGAGMRGGMSEKLSEDGLRCRWPLAVKKAPIEVPTVTVKEFCDEAETAFDSFILGVLQIFFKLHND